MARDKIVLYCTVEFSLRALKTFVEKAKHGTGFQKNAVSCFPNISSLSSLIDLLLHPIVSLSIKDGQSILMLMGGQVSS